MYDIKKIMRGIFINKDQVPAIRFEVVMDCIPEEMQPAVEEALKEFECKVKDIVLAANTKDNTTSGQASGIAKKLVFRNGKPQYEPM